MSKFSVEQQLARAKSYIKKQRYHEAYALFHEILKLYPNNKKAQVGIINVNKLLAKTQNSVPPKELLDQLVHMLNHGQFSDVKARSIKLTKVYPNAFLVWNFLGTSCAQLKEFDNAIEAFKNAVKIKTDFVEGFNNIGNLLKDTGKIEDALQFYKKALKIRPTFADAHYNIGLCYKELDDIQSAVNSINAAISYEPNHCNAINALGNLMREKGEITEAILAYEKAIKLNPQQSEPWLNLGQSLYVAERYQDAQIVLLKQIAQGKNLPSAHFYLGKVYEAEENFNKALEAYKESINFGFRSADCYFSLANMYNEIGDLEKRLENVKLTLELEPAHPGALFNLGQINFDQHNYEDAIKAYNEALESEPGNSGIWNNIGITFLKQGKLRSALDSLTKACVLDKKGTIHLTNLSELLTQLTKSDPNLISEYEECIEAISKSLLQHPKLVILEAIKNYINANYTQVIKLLNVFNTVYRRYRLEIDPKDDQFCSAFYNFLSALMKEGHTKQMKTSISDKIFHIGESHCLSFSNRPINLNGKVFEISPLLTFGAKAYHLSQSEGNSFKSITEVNFKSIPSGSKVFISFGEIDCRANEGFLTASVKTNMPTPDLVKTTVLGYLEWFYGLNQTAKHELFFFNVPAPIISSEDTDVITKDVAELIKIFNATIASLLPKYGFNLIDVYKFTALDTGFSNGQFHIDSRHLGANALVEIETQLKRLKVKAG